VAPEERGGAERRGPAAGAEDSKPRGEPETAISRARDAVIAGHPDIAEYRRLRGKALPTTEQRERLRAMLADPALIDAAKGDLCATEPSLTDEGQYKRMSRADFLDAALEWHDNPARASVLEAVEEAIFAPNIGGARPIELQRSLAGDKMELFMSLLDRDPARAEEIAARARGTNLERLLSYVMVRHSAAKNYEKGGG
jgi:hypothetical protein